MITHCLVDEGLDVWQFESVGFSWAPLTAQDLVDFIEEAGLDVWEVCDVENGPVESVGDGLSAGYEEVLDH